jgi:hypothetical protein
MSDREMDAYVQLMVPVKERVGLVGLLLSDGHLGLGLRVAVESASLQMRMVLETVALAPLIARPAAYGAGHSRFAKEWHAGKIVSHLRSLHPQFYPVATLASESTQAGIKLELTPRPHDYLQESEFESVYGRLGGWCHVANPLGRPRDLQAVRMELIEIRTRVINLLDWHRVRLIGDEPNQHLVRLTDPATASGVGWYRLSRKQPDAVSGDSD